MNFGGRTDDGSIFSFQRMLFRYRYAKKYLKRGSVLDIGCGYGYAAEFFDDYVGIDCDPDAIDICSAKYPKAKFQVMNAPPLNFADGSFTNVICAEMIEHIKQDDASLLLKECHRILKKNGILFLSTPNAANRLQTWHGHFKEYSFSEMCCLLKENMFRIIKYSGMSISLLPNRFDQNTNFWRLRNRFYKKITDRKFVKKASFLKRIVKAMIWLFLVFIAKMVIYSGHVFPSKAEYQIWICQKV